MDIFKKNNELKEKYEKDYSFELFLNHLDYEELLISIEYILLGDSKFLNLFFPTLKNLDQDEIAYDKLFVLPGFLIDRISEYIDLIFQRALEGNYASKSKDILKKIIALSVNKEMGLTSNYIVSRAFDKQVPAYIRINLLYLLDERKLHKQVDIFIRSFQLINDPYLLPFILDKIYKDKKEKVISLIKHFCSFNHEKPDDEVLQWFFSTIYDIIQNADSNKEYSYLFKLVHEMKYWLKDLTISIFKQEEFSDLFEKFIIYEYIPAISTQEVKSIEENLNYIYMINNKYSDPEMRDAVIKIDEADQLFDLTINYNFLSSTINPFIRNQIHLNRFKVSDDSYSNLVNQISNIQSLTDLTAQLNRTNSSVYYE